MVELRLPNITGLTEKEQIAQVKSYLYQLTGQLQYALTNLEGTTSNAIALSQKTGSKSAQITEPQATFDSIKSLIIKSADIVQAYYEEIDRRLVGEYVAKSDFGTYSEQTSQDINENSVGIERLFTNIQQIETDIDNMEYTLIEVKARINSGLLYYTGDPVYDDSGNRVHDENGIPLCDGVPVYGIEIGQTNTIDGTTVFNKFARFTSDRLSFYDQNGNEAAYISDYKLYIRNVEITVSYKIGGFVDTVQSNDDVVTRWVGGNE